MIQELSHKHFETQGVQAIELLDSTLYIRLGLQSGATETNSKLSALNGEEIHDGWRILPSAIPCQVKNY